MEFADASVCSWLLGEEGRGRVRGRKRERQREREREIVRRPGQSAPVGGSSGDQVSVFFFFFTLVTGPTRSLNLNPSDTRVYAPQTRAQCVGKGPRRSELSRGYFWENLVT